MSAAARTNTSSNKDLEKIGYLLILFDQTTPAMPGKSEKYQQFTA